MFAYPNTDETIPSKTYSTPCSRAVLQTISIVQSTGENTGGVAGLSKSLCNPHS